MIMNLKNEHGYLKSLAAPAFPPPFNLCYQTDIAFTNILKCLGGGVKHCRTNIDRWWKGRGKGKGEGRI